jgi:hypothetical protein
MDYTALYPRRWYCSLKASSSNSLCRFFPHISFTSADPVSSNCYFSCRYYLGIPEARPGQLHLYRTTSVTPRVGVPLSAPHCLTCQPEEHSHHAYSSYYTSMAGGRPGTSSGEETDEWGEDDDETTPVPTQSPLAKRTGENTLCLHLT